MIDETTIEISGEDRRSGEERRKTDRRRQNLGPPTGAPERRTGKERRLFDRRVQGSTTGQLLIEVGRFAAENMVFRQKGNKAAARRARKHLSQVMKLAKQRRAEISDEIKGAAGDGSPETDQDNGADSADE